MIQFDINCLYLSQRAAWPIVDCVYGRLVEIQCLVYQVIAETMAFTTETHVAATMHDQTFVLHIDFLPRDAMHKRGLCHHAVPVCLSVTFVSCVKTNKDIIKIFSPSGSHAILVFPCQTA